MFFEELESAGFVILPREPDEGMIDAASEVLFRPEFDGVETTTLMPPVYRAMVQHYESKGEAE